MKNKMLLWITSLLLIIFIVVPIFVQYLHFIPGTKGNGDWLGFWGSYLGIIPSGLIAYAVARYQIDNENKRQGQMIQRELYINNLYSVYKKLRKLDPFFKYGPGERYLNDTLEEIHPKDAIDIQNKLDILHDYFLELDVFDNLDELILDVYMMPDINSSDIYTNLEKLKIGLLSMSGLVGNTMRDYDEVKYEDVVIIYQNLKELYSDNANIYHETLQKISDKIYKQ